MEVSESGKDSDNMLHSLLAVESCVGVSTEHVNYRSLQLNPNDQEAQHIQPDQNLTLDELHWHTPAPISSMPGCEGTVEVFSINDTFVWQTPTIQEDRTGSLQPLESLTSDNSKIDEDSTKIDESYSSFTKGRQKNGKLKSISHGRTISKKKSIKGKASSTRAVSQDSQAWLNIADGLNASPTLNEKNESNEYVKSASVEDDVSQVKKRFSLGCECQDSNCFDGLNPETVFRHRLNIAELTKEEHDMYLMGLTMACLSDWEHTNRNKERQRLRANYVHQGRTVCLQAFLYLENCTCYQVKRIRKHVMTHGVVPRIHGNHGKRPHNTLALEIYCHATEFLKSFVRDHGGKDCQSKNSPLLLGPDVTRKYVHQSYLEYCRTHVPDGKVMSYSTFRHFMKEQFPYIRFRLIEGPGVPREGTLKHSLVSNHCHDKSDLSHLSVPDPNPAIASSSQEMEVITFAQVVMNGNEQPTHSGQELQNSHQSTLPSDNNIVVIDAVPLNSTNPFMSSPVGNRANVNCSNSIAPKVLTINSSSLRFVNSGNINAIDSSALVPMNSIAMFGANIFPFVLDGRDSKQMVSDNL